MSQLTKGMYGSQFERASKLFSLACGQCRGRDFVHNGGWYNKQGEKLGWGDLSPDDFMGIRRELEDGEFFIILGEQDSFWNFVTRPGLLGHNAAVKPDVEAPGIDFVAEKCRFIIGQGKHYLINDYQSAGDDATRVIDGLLFYVLTREEAKQLIATSAASAPTPVASQV